MTDIPHVTHTGILELFGIKLFCHRLSNGQCVIEAESFEKIMEWMENDMINEEAARQIAAWSK
jgi:hypothetical protein